MKIQAAHRHPSFIEELKEQALDLWPKDSKGFHPKKLSNHWPQIAGLFQPSD
jgi:hypothetical protein